MECRICPRNCGVDRRHRTGVCGVGDTLRLNLWQPHFGEEPPISGIRGSGTIFFSGCNLRCCYCQNWQISQLAWGQDYTPAQLVDIMLALQGQGMHNINLVTPTHFTPLIVEAVQCARDQGLRLPIVWNTSGYESVTTLRTLEGVVDIYLADFRYWDVEAARRYSGAADYPERAREAFVEMFRQVGHMRLDDEGIARRGLLTRLLVLPGNVNRVDLILHWLAGAIGPETWVSLMSQYYPVYRAADCPEINRTVGPAEFNAVVAVLDGLGFEDGFVQELAASSPEWTPDFQEDGAGQLTCPPVGAAPAG